MNFSENNSEHTEGLKQIARIAVLVSGGGTNLQALINAQNQGILKSGRLTLVISNNSKAFALARAKKAGIPQAVITKKLFNNDQKAFEAALAEALEKNKTDLIILAGFMSILSENFTKRFEERIINVHPSLIPSFCGKGFYGLRVHEAALERGVKISGATVHFVNEIPDGGKIICQKAVEVLDTDTPETLQKRIMEQAEWVILPMAAEKISSLITQKQRA